MDFRIADTFTGSLARLTNDEQKIVKTTAFDLQLDPASPGMKLHRIERSKDRNFWSIRAGSDLRIVVHKTASSFLLCYAAHHDDAYRWAERRKLETHPTTGAAQLVEVREYVHDVVVPRYVEADATAPPENTVAPPRPAAAPLLGHVSAADLLAFGVPEEWIADVQAATEETILDLASYLPGEAAEAVLVLATGGSPVVPAAAPEGTDPFEHPDAQRRFRTVESVEELQSALDFPWEKWTVFLHPAQRRAVERTYSGPARISGSAGTGKTIVALHRAVFLARTFPEARVLLATFSGPLARALKAKLKVLAGAEPRLGERIDVRVLGEMALRLYSSTPSPLGVASEDVLRRLIAEAVEAEGGSAFAASFLLAEWTDVVDAWGLGTWEAYQSVPRLGRKTRLPEAQRRALWAVFERVREGLAAQKLTTHAGMLAALGASLAGRGASIYDFIIVDEAQDVSVADLRLLAVLGGGRPGALFFTGDLGQRIFQPPFSWKTLGVDVRGRSRTLRINYRTSHQIRAHADRLLGPELGDVDGNVESRRSTVSVFNGPAPQVEVCESQEHEIEIVGAWLRERAASGDTPREIGVFVRTEAEIPRAAAAVARAHLPANVLDERVEAVSGRVSIGTMHLVKGLEFRSVVVMACDDDVIPSPGRIEAAAEESDVKEVYETERHLLYVACTRARDHLLITSAERASEFLDDLRA